MHTLGDYRGHNSIAYQEVRPRAVKPFGERRERVRTACRCRRADAAGGRPTHRFGRGRRVDGGGRPWGVRRCAQADARICPEAGQPRRREMTASARQRPANHRQALRTCGRGQAAKHRRRRKAASSSEASHQPHRPASGAQSFQTRPPSKTRTLAQHTPPPIPSPSSAPRFCWNDLGELRVRERKNLLGAV